MPSVPTVAAPLVAAASATCTEVIAVNFALWHRFCRLMLTLMHNEHHADG
jgi:hypothetical protein